jgi:DNA-binding response OmpR family regulator
MFLYPLRIKVLAFGNKIMLRRLISQVDKDEISITGCIKASEAIAKMNTEQFSLIIVDYAVADAEQFCRDVVNNTHIPLVVMIQKKYTDWKAMRKIEVDGYIPDDTGSDELAARIRAYARRNPAVQNV